MAELIPYPIEDLRRDLLIQLSVTPRHLFRELWSPTAGFKDAYRRELVARLTAGWDRFEVLRPPAPPTHSIRGGSKVAFPGDE